MKYLFSTILILLTITTSCKKSASQATEMTQMERVIAGYYESKYGLSFL